MVIHWFIMPIYRYHEKYLWLRPAVPSKRLRAPAVSSWTTTHMLQTVDVIIIALCNGRILCTRHALRQLQVMDVIDKPLPLFPPSPGDHRIVRRWNESRSLVLKLLSLAGTFDTGDIVLVVPEFGCVDCLSYTLRVHTYSLLSERAELNHATDNRQLTAPVSSVD